MDILTNIFFIIGYQTEITSGVTLNSWPAPVPLVLGGFAHDQPSKDFKRPSLPRFRMFWLCDILQGILATTFVVSGRHGGVPSLGLEGHVPRWNQPSVSLFWYRRCRSGTSSSGHPS